MKFIQHRTKFQTFWLVTAVILLITACNSALPGQEEQATVTSQAALEITPEGVSPTQEAESGPVHLRMWLPPDFSPSRGDLAATILQTQIDGFREENPNVQIEVRLKEESGEGGMIASLEAARAAAPLALPDLVLLSSEVLPGALESDLLLPLDEYLSTTLDQDWYAFGLQSVQSEGQTYGLPFAGDALIMMHRFSAQEQLPGSWAESLEEPLAIGFAAADPNAYFSLIQLAHGSSLNGLFAGGAQPNEEQIRNLLTYYFDGGETGIFPFWLSQFDNPEQSWQAFIEGRTSMVVTWSSRFLSTSDSNLGAGLLPTHDGQGFTFAKSWAWTLTAPEGTQTVFARDLAEHLTEPEFLAQWTAAAGLLPARSSSLTAWSPDQRQALASQVVPIASLLPNADQRVQIGQPLSEATVALLKGETTVNLALQSVLNSLSLP